MGDVQIKNCCRKTKMRISDLFLWKVQLSCPVRANTGSIPMSFMAFSQEDASSDKGGSLNRWNGSLLPH